MQRSGCKKKQHISCQFQNGKLSPHCNSSPCQIKEMIEQRGEGEGREKGGERNGRKEEREGRGKEEGRCAYTARLKN